MAIDPDYVADILDRLSELGPVAAKPMFGGRGIFLGGLMFAKISPDNIVAFKADDRNRASFVEAGMRKSGKMPYYEATAEQLEDDAAFVDAARLACDAGRRAAK